jgi:serine O-acetyltransferase
MSERDPADLCRDWALDPIVAELRAASGDLEGAWRRARGRHTLPSREALVRIVADLRAILFPAHFGPSDLSLEGVRYFVGHKLDATLTSLYEQVRRSIRYEAEDAACTDAIDAQAAALTRAFAARLPAVRALLDSDVRAAYEGDPAAHSVDEALFCYPGITAILHHRLAHELHVLGLPLVPRIIAEIAHAETGIDIHPGATIGASFFIDHGTGVVIGETCAIGQRVRIYQGVTLGAKSFPLDERGSPIKGLPRHPTVEDDVVIYSGATILGRITIGRGSTVGGNVWLTRSVPPHSRVTQAHAHSEVFGDGSGI